MALITLGADEAYVRDYSEEYAKKLEAPEKFADDLDPEIELSGDLRELLGRRIGYQRLKEYYGEKMRGQDLATVMGEVFPGLCPGMIGSAAHGLIHMGYGFAAGCKSTVCEGLAYLHYCSMPLETPTDLADPKLGHGPLGILDVLRDVKKSKLQRWMMMKILQAPWDTFNTGFQKKAAVLNTCKADELLQYVYQIKFPEELHQQEGRSVQEQAIAIGNWLVDIAITAYTIAETKNDFFLAHGVTSAWALKQILPCLNSRADLTKVTAVYLAALINVYIVRGCQTLSPEELQDDRKLSSWDAIIQRTLAVTNRDEHIYKLVQVCNNMSQQPGIDAAKERLYKQAAELAITQPLFGESKASWLD